MDYLWTPWRYQYITTADKVEGCPFCLKFQAGNDRQALIVQRAQHNFIILNLFPYTAGHLMVVPYNHVDSLLKLSSDAVTEMMALTQRLEGVLRKLYDPGGIN